MTSAHVAVNVPCILKLTQFCYLEICTGVIHLNFLYFYGQFQCSFFSFVIDKPISIQK